MPPDSRILTGVHWNRDDKDPLRKWALKEPSDLLYSLTGAVGSNEVRHHQVVLHLNADKGRLVGKRNARNLGILDHLHRASIPNQTFDLVCNVGPSSANLPPNKRASSSGVDGIPWLHSP